MIEFDEILFETNDFDIDNVIQDPNSIKFTYDIFKRDISAIEDRTTILRIHRSNCSLNILEGNTFDGFYHLTDLDLSHNILAILPKGVFDQLFNLKVVNLSHNLISQLEDNVFSWCQQLILINLSNNFLNEINSYAFNNLRLLRKLDLSYNKIRKLSNKCLHVPSLEELNLNHNEIVELNNYPFCFLENLIDLQLSNNRIYYLKDTMFLTTTKIENLNLCNNFVSRLEKKIFNNLPNLKQINLSNNLLLNLGRCFENKPMLHELNLLNNPIGGSWLRHLFINKNIRTLKITIENILHKLQRLEYLELLSDFELHVKIQRIFSVPKYILNWLNPSTIQRLYIVIQRGELNVKNDITNLVNLEFLHIEFLDPHDQLHEFNIGFHINHMAKLEHLALININKLIITNQNIINHNYLTYLDLTGISNVYYNFLQNNFAMLEYLNLSKSQIRYISSDLLKNLINLKYLLMNNTAIFFITDRLFQYNSKLEKIDFKDCQIHTIDENCFRNLEKLNQIDIRGNKQLRITQSLLNGIPKSAVVFYD